MLKKRSLRNEYREDWKTGRRREIGHLPNRVYQQRKEAAGKAELEKYARSRPPFHREGA